MTKKISALELTLNEPGPQQTLSEWLYKELSRAILDGRLPPATRLPATRDFARQYGISRGVVVNVFERLQTDGYISSQVGAGTWVKTACRRPLRRAAKDWRRRRRSGRRP